MLRWLTTLIPTTLLAAVVVVAPSPAGSFGGIQFVTNASLDYDHGLHTGLPNGWGDGEFTLKVVISPDDSAPIGETQSSSGRINNWANETAEPYSDPQWWFLGNFLLDGHNNSVYANGTFSFQIHNSGYMRWLFGDGSGSIPTGGLWAVQDDSQVNVLDGGRHIVHVTREFTGASDSTLRMYVDGTLVGTEVSDARATLYTTYWTGNSWSDYPAEQEGWDWAAEKQAANGDIEYADYKGLLEELVFYADDLSAGEISADQGVVDDSHADYLDHFAFGEGAGTTTTSENGITMTLANEQSGGFWP